MWPATKSPSAPDRRLTSREFPGATTFYLAFIGISPSGPSVEVQANVDLKWNRVRTDR